MRFLTLEDVPFRTESLVKEAHINDDSKCLYFVNKILGKSVDEVEIAEMS